MYWRTAAEDKFSESAMHGPNQRCTARYSEKMHDAVNFLSLLGAGFVLPLWPKFYFGHNIDLVIFSKTIDNIRVQPHSTQCCD